ncbi:hypothetical protein N9081_07580, partial [Akkermansiaceae bacterium]|nr:hypothetical protein [Akkermansiaceae bacterium]
SEDEISERGFLVVEFLESGNVSHTGGLIGTEMKSEGEKKFKNLLASIVWRIYFRAVHNDKTTRSSNG